jgi:hypothetical protein
VIIISVLVSCPQTLNSKTLDFIYRDIQFPHNIKEYSCSIRSRFVYISLYLGRDGSVGTATRYGLDGPGIEPRWEAWFSAPVRTSRGVHPACYTMGTGSFLRVQRPGHGLDHLPPSSAKVKERVEIYLYSPSAPSWPVLGWTLLIVVYVIKMFHQLLSIRYTVTFTLLERKILKKKKKICIGSKKMSAFSFFEQVSRNLRNQSM